MPAQPPQMKHQPIDKAGEGRGERMDRGGEGEERRRRGGGRRGGNRETSHHTPGMKTSWLMKGP